MRLKTISQSQETYAPLVVVVVVVVVGGNFVVSDVVDDFVVVGRDVVGDVFAFVSDVVAVAVVSFPVGVGFGPAKEVK